MPDAITTATAAEPSAEAVNATADKLAKLERNSELDRKTIAGRMIIDAFYGGDLALWNKRNRGDRTIEALAKALEERDTAWNATRLYRAVRLYEQWRNLGNFEEWPKLM